MPTVKIHDLDIERLAFGPLTPYSGKSGGGYIPVTYAGDKSALYIQINGARAPLGITMWDNKPKIPLSDMSEDTLAKLREIENAFLDHVKKEHGKEKWAKKDATPLVKEPSSEDRQPLVNAKVTEWTKYVDPAGEKPRRGEEPPPLISIEGALPDSADDGERPFGGIFRGSTGDFVVRLSGWVVPATGYGLGVTCNLARMTPESQTRGAQFADDDDDDGEDNVADNGIGFADDDLE